MSNDLTLPFAALGDTPTLAADPDLAAFSITLTAGGGTAIQGQSFGTGDYYPTGIYGETDTGTAVRGNAISSGQGVTGNSEQSFGVVGTNGGVSPKDTPEPDSPGAGVAGFSYNNYGVWGGSGNYDGVKGVTNSPANAGVSAINAAPAPAATTGPSAFGLWAHSNGTAIFAQGNPAGYFQGDVQVTGDVILVNSSGDVAEDFDVEDGSEHVEPGTVLVIGSNGKLCASRDPYDTRVAGVVSGAGSLKPAIVLQRIESRRQRSPIALVGKAFCKVDALFGSINPGDLLTTSPTPGHAMKLIDHTRATGTILGKALGGLEDGQGLIPILVTPR